MESSDSEIKASAIEAVNRASKDLGASPLDSTRRKSYLRSQSATSSKSSVTKDEKSSEGAHAVSQENLTTVKTSSTEPITISSSIRSSQKSEQDEPLLTLASSLKDNSNITIGFNVKDEAKSN